MSSKKNRKTKHLLASLVTANRAPCAFCRQNVDDEVLYGKLYAIGDIQCHYFCVLLSCCLIQKGKDTEGLFGFLYEDILAEIERSKKHKCSFCREGGATLGCSVRECRRQFHLPCGREKSAVSLFYGNFKSYCRDHAPKQRLPDHIMANVRARQKYERGKKRASLPVQENGQANRDIAPTDPPAECVCVICYETVEGFPSPQTFWPPCCARDAWFHRSCLQRMALTAGMHYLKCPLCNDKENFYDAVINQGYYVPDRDAAWELEQNAFAEIYERPLTCSAADCLCPRGREHDEDKGPWDIRLCILCGTTGIHRECHQKGGPQDNEIHDNASENRGIEQNSEEKDKNSQEEEKDETAEESFVIRFVCTVCKPAAPEDIDSLAATLEKLIQVEQNQRRNPSRRGPVMPSRMSLRRTKQRPEHLPSTSQSGLPKKEIPVEEKSEQDLMTSRQELNLTTPKRKPKTQTNQEKPNHCNNPTTAILKNSPSAILNNSPSAILKNIENKLMSPIKMLEESLYEKIKCMGVSETEIHLQHVIERVRDKFKKPRPLREKKRILNEILESIFNNITKDARKTKDPLREWSSPKKTYVDNDEEGFRGFQVPAATKPWNGENIFEGIILGKENLNKFLNEESILREENELDSKGADEKHKTEDKIEENDKSSENVDNSKDVDKTKKVSDVTSLETPKLKMIDIEKDSSLEISENDDVINIDVLKLKSGDANKSGLIDFDSGSPPVIEKASIKFNPVNKEISKNNNIDVDLESFKHRYLNEIEKIENSNATGVDENVKNEKEDFTNIENLNEDAKHEAQNENNKVTENGEPKTEGPKNKNKKHKLSMKRRVTRNSINKTENLDDANITNDNSKNDDAKTHKGNRKKVLRKKVIQNSSDNVKETNRGRNKKLKHSKNKNSKERSRKTEDKRKNLKRKLNNEDEIPNKKIRLQKYVIKYKKKNDARIPNSKSNIKKHKQKIQFKIKFRDERMRLKKEHKKLKIKIIKQKEIATKQLKQCILSFDPEVTSFVVKPEDDVNSSLKKKKCKLEKSPDHLKQTSISSFFKIKIVEGT